VETTLHDVLLDQLGMLSLDERRFKIAEQIVGSIDDDGYLRRLSEAYTRFFLDYSASPLLVVNSERLLIHWVM